MRMKRKKNVRLRGSKTHGGGAMKKRRGAGNRGGRGHAGSGKRADQTKPRIWADPLYFGKHGFTRPHARKLEACTLRFIEEHTDELLQSGKIKQEQGFIVVDLKALGYDKLLSSGTVTRKYRVMAFYAAGRVAEKLKEADGELVLRSLEPKPKKDHKTA